MAGRLLAFILLWICSPESSAQQIPLERYTHPSGMAVVLNKDSSSPVASVGLMYKVGRNNEPYSLKNINAIITYLRHESTQNLRSGDYKSYIERYAGDNAIDVGYDLTFFADSFSSNMIKGALWLASEKAQNIRYDSIDIDKIKNQVDKTERSRLRGLNYSEVESLYKIVETVNHRIPTSIGSYENGITQDVLSRYDSLYYNPKNAVLVVSGDIDVDSVKIWVSDMFVRLPQAEQMLPVKISEKFTTSVTTPSLEIPDSDKGAGILSVDSTISRVDTLYMEQGNESVIYAWQIPPYTDVQFTAFEFISTILCKDKSSRLYKALAEDAQIAIDVTPYILPMGRASVFAFKVRLRSGYKGSDVDAIVRQALESLKSSYVSPSELKKGTNNATMNLLATISSNMGMLATLAKNELLYGNANHINAQIEGISRITKEDILQVSKRFLRDDNMKIIYEVPIKQVKK